VRTGPLPRLAYPDDRGAADHRGLSFRACIDPIFGPTAASFSWSSSARADFIPLVWGVSFEDGTAWPTDKSNAAYVRAVRGGS
jgi:hypothetical protein